MKMLEALSKEMRRSLDVLGTMDSGRSPVVESESSNPETTESELVKEYKNAYNVFQYTNKRFNNVKNMGDFMTYETLIVESCAHILYDSHKWFEKNFFGNDENGGKYLYFKLVNILPTLEHTKRYSEEYCMATEDDSDALITALYSYHVSKVKVVFQVFDKIGLPTTNTFEQDVDIESFDWRKLEEAFNKMPERERRFKLRVR